MTPDDKKLYLSDSDKDTLGKDIMAAIQSGVISLDTAMNAITMNAIAQVVTRREKNKTIVSDSIREIVENPTRKNTYKHAIKIVYDVEIETKKRFDVLLDDLENAVAQLRIEENSNDE